MSDMPLARLTSAFGGWTGHGERPTATSGFASVDLDKDQRIWVPVVDYRCEKPIALAHAREVPMSDDPADVIKDAIRSAFVSYPKEDDPDWRSPSWIMPKECAQLTNVIMRECHVPCR